jgi:hypothetical protein
VLAGLRARNFVESLEDADGLFDRAEAVKMCDTWGV